MNAISNVAQNVGHTLYKIIHSPVALAQAAYNHPKTTLATLTAIGGLAALAYYNQEAIKKHGEPLADYLTQSFNSLKDKAQKWTQDGLAHFGFAENRMEKIEVCTKGWFSTTCEIFSSPISELGITTPCIKI